ncbi:hypothetical protein MKW98_029064 [Papaver atlanticum]|uniref:Uncharacterized protein n=1 Tax=Papaver atlanticum TaxID=357466 RepID=A0AAD4RZ53_9MAGN|nr:hypothetical protein MKW98_029064 [Papaver atlanticum]
MENDQRLPVNLISLTDLRDVEVIELLEKYNHWELWQRKVKELIGVFPVSDAAEGIDRCLLVQYYLKVLQLFLGKDAPISFGNLRYP